MSSNLDDLYELIGPPRETVWILTKPQADSLGLEAGDMGFAGRVVISEKIPTEPRAPKIIDAQTGKEFTHEKFDQWLLECSNDPPCETKPGSPTLCSSCYSRQCKVSA